MSFQWLNSYLENAPIDAIHLPVIGINVIIFLFAGYIIKMSPKAISETRLKRSTLGLRAISMALFMIYVFDVLWLSIAGAHVDSLVEISQTGLTILVSYVVLHFVQGWIIVRFGKVKEVNGETLRGESYASEMIGLIGLILVSSIAFLIIINIWDLNDWLQATSVIGGVLLILFASKDYFLGDMISGLIMHYNYSVEAGSVVRVKELGVTGVVTQITLSQTIIRDLVQKHEITIPNSRLRNATVETISNCTKNGFREYLDFKIVYDQSPERVQEFLNKVWQQSAENEAGINSDAKPKIVVIENGDHAVTWRLLFYVSNPYRLLDARNTVQTIAFGLSQQEKLGLNTPVTHQILSGGLT
ncbi:MAG: mechanosensitive ion channel family protein [Kangiellaceae bacterium]|nr:mechanosensitive ion channel family protein [Kangiellaceae bacterium]